MRVAIVLWFVIVGAVAQADVIPPLPEPDCDPGYVVTWTHGGPQCVRPSCRSDADCPPGLGLVCPPGYCFRWMEDRECLEREGLGSRDREPGTRNAFEPPPLCPQIQRREGPESCLTTADCGAGLLCSPRSCRPGTATTMTTMSETTMSETTMSETTMSETTMSETMSETMETSETMSETMTNTMSGTTMSSETSNESTNTDEGRGCAAGGLSASWLGILALVALRRRYFA